MKYTIKKIINLNDINEIYSKFLQYSEQNNLFCSEEILKFFFNSLDLYIILKNDKIKSFIYLYKNKFGELISEPFIYSGIINQPRFSMKNSRYNNEVFKINNLIVNEILSNYKSININLPLNFTDTRPFLWFNYNETKKRKFTVTPRYTSLINLSYKDKDSIFNEIDDVKRRDIRKGLIDKNYEVSHKINLNLIKKFYVETMNKNNGDFDKFSFERIFEFIATQVKKDKIIQSTTYFKGKPLYSVLFLINDLFGTYLYGCGDLKIKDRLAGSLALWKAIDLSIDKKLKLIDLEGINSPSRGEYKLYFGGNIECYYHIKM